MDSNLNGLVLKKSNRFNSLFDSTNLERKASKEEVEKVFEKQFVSLKDVITSLQKVGLYLSPEEEIPIPQDIPHIIFKWPIKYNWAPDEYFHEENKNTIGYVIRLLNL